VTQLLKTELQGLTQCPVNENEVPLSNENEKRAPLLLEIPLPGPVSQQRGKKNTRPGNENENQGEA